MRFHGPATLVLTLTLVIPACARQGEPAVEAEALGPGGDPTPTAFCDGTSAYHAMREAETRARTALYEATREIDLEKRDCDHEAALLFSSEMSDCFAERDVIGCQQAAARRLAGREAACRSRYQADLANIDTRAEPAIRRACEDWAWAHRLWEQSCGLWEDTTEGGVGYVDSRGRHRTMTCRVGEPTYFYNPYLHPFGI